MQKQLTLAVTTIGDLLLENTITSNKECVDLRIPEYQRPYKWTAKNANQLLDDIIQAMNDKKEVYRVGTLILHRDNGIYNIVDGQQRTITFALLLNVLGEDDIDFLDNKLFNNQYNIHNIKNNFRTYKRRLSVAEANGALKEFVKNKCELIVVITENLSEAFQFFDSQNARGKALYPHDLLKAYHLREMRNITVEETEKIVKIWEDTDQKKLSRLFSEYLYRIKEWAISNRPDQLNEKNIDIFKGITAKDNQPYAQYYKGAFAYADGLNHSPLPFVTGSKMVKPFQINVPVIAGKPFFEYAKHYFDLLTDIQDNDKYRGYFINGNEIVKTLDTFYNRRIGDRITRILFDSAVLLYVDRFCPIIPSREDLDIFDKFTSFAFIWAYSMRAQYQNVSWLVAQNYVEGKSDVKNSLNIFKTIVEMDSPNRLISKLSDCLMPLITVNIKDGKDSINDCDKEEDGVFVNYLHYFVTLKFLED